MEAGASKAPRFDRDVDGILLLDKPTGATSNAVLQRVRRLFRARKAGHAGSLDPLASGMLPVCFGQATKICAFLLDADKTYRFTARLGERSATGDADGEIVERREIPTLDASRVAAVLQSFLGPQSQIPPMYSALKVAGERLYVKARRGEDVERAPRSINIDSLQLLQFAERDLQLEVTCSKGTYVRVLAEDIALRLGTVAHLVALRRVSVRPFDAAALVTIDDLATLAQRDLAALDALLLPSDQALPHLAQVEFDAEGTRGLLQGRAEAGLGAAGVNAHVRMYGPAKQFLGVGQMLEGQRVQPRRLCVDPAINP